MLPGGGPAEDGGPDTAHSLGWGGMLWAVGREVSGGDWPSAWTWGSGSEALTALDGVGGHLQ